MEKAQRIPQITNGRDINIILTASACMEAAKNMAGFIRDNNIQAVIGSGGNAGYTTRLLRKVIAEKYPDCKPRFLGMGFISSTKENCARADNIQTRKMSADQLKASYSRRLMPLLRDNRIAYDSRIFVFEEFSHTGRSLARACKTMASLGFNNLKSGSLVVGVHQITGWLSTLNPDFIGAITMDDAPYFSRLKLRRDLTSTLLLSRAARVPEARTVLRSAALMASNEMRKRMDKDFMLYFRPSEAEKEPETLDHPANLSA